MHSSELANNVCKKMYEGIKRLKEVISRRCAMVPVAGVRMQKTELASSSPGSMAAAGGS